MFLANIYFVLGCKKPAVMFSRVPKSNVVPSPFFLVKIAVFKKGYCQVIPHHAHCNTLEKTKLTSRSSRGRSQNLNKIGTIVFPPPDGPRKWILKGILIQSTGRPLSRLVFLTRSCTLKRCFWATLDLMAHFLEPSGGGKTIPPILFSFWLLPPDGLVFRHKGSFLNL